MSSGEGPSKRITDEGPSKSRLRVRGQSIRPPLRLPSPAHSQQERPPIRAPSLVRSHHFSSGGHPAPPPTAVPSPPYRPSTGVGTESNPYDWSDHGTPVYEGPRLPPRDEYQERFSQYIFAYTPDHHLNYPVPYRYQHEAGASSVVPTIAGPSHPPRMRVAPGEIFRFSMPSPNTINRLNQGSAGLGEEEEEESEEEEEEEEPDESIPMDAEQSIVPTPPAQPTTVYNDPYLPPPPSAPYPTNPPPPSHGHSASNQPLPQAGPYQEVTQPGQQPFANLDNWFYSYPPLPPYNQNFGQPQYDYTSYNQNFYPTAYPSYYPNPTDMYPYGFPQPFGYPYAYPQNPAIPPPTAASSTVPPGPQPVTSDILAQTLEEIKEMRKDVKRKEKKTTKMLKKFTSVFGKGKKKKHHESDSD